MEPPRPSDAGIGPAAGRDPDRALSAGADPYAALAAAVNAQVALRYHCRVTLVQYPAQGNFPWYFQNANQVFNQATFDYVSARVMPGDAPALARLSPPGGFPNAYAALLDTITYALSAADQQTYDRAADRAADGARQLVATYRQAFGATAAGTDGPIGAGGTGQPIAPVTGAGPAAPVRGAADPDRRSVELVVDQVLGSLWSGRAARGEPPLPTAALASVADPAVLLPAMPPSGDAVLAAALTFLEQAPETVPLRDEANFAEWALTQLVRATVAPDTGNGGMLTVDPGTGSVSAGYQVGYAVTTPLATIQNALQDAANRLTVTIPAASGGSITITYPGSALVAVEPVAWQQATNIGWFDLDPVVEAYRNVGRDTTGYRFTSPPAYDPGPLQAGGDLGRLTALLVSNPPEITASGPLSPANAAAFVADELALLGPAFTAAATGRGRPPAPDAVARPVATGGGSVPLLQQTACVVGACVDFPAAPPPAPGGGAAGTPVTRSSGSGPPTPPPASARR